MKDRRCKIHRSTLKEDEPLEVASTLRLTQRTARADHERPRSVVGTHPRKSMTTDRHDQRNFLPWLADAPLQTVLSAGAVVAASAGSDDAAPSESLPDVLHGRLVKFDALLDPEHESRSRSLELESLKIGTVLASLFVLRCVDTALREQENSGKADEPLIGTRDLAQLRIHMSLVFRWGVDELLNRILPTLPKRPSKARIPPGAQVIDLTAAHEDYELLAQMLVTLLRMCRHPSQQEKAPTTLVANVLLMQQFASFLRCCVCLGWLPKDLRGDMTAVDEIMEGTVWLLDTCASILTLFTSFSILTFI